MSDYITTSELPRANLQSLPFVDVLLVAGTARIALKRLQFHPFALDYLGLPDQVFEMGRVFSLPRLGDKTQPKATVALGKKLSMTGRTGGNPFTMKVYASERCAHPLAIRASHISSTSSFDIQDVKRVTLIVQARKKDILSLKRENVIDQNTCDRYLSALNE